jgi:ribosome-associated protein
MSKKHPGINDWKKHIQLGRRKPGAAGPFEDAQETTDARKPPGWQGRAAKAKDRREGGSSPRPAVAQEKSAPPWKSASGKPQGKPQGKPYSGKPAFRAQTPVITAPKRVLVRPLDGEGRPYITLVQFLKSINAVDTGGAGKHFVRAGGILVNGIEDLRPGRKLHTGDVVKVAGVEHKITV